MKRLNATAPSRRRLLWAMSLCLCAPALVRAATASPLTFAELYKSFGVRGYEFADRILTLNGHEVAMQGYMAPPLKPESSFFVLTREPLALCPFCQSDAEWPVDIVVIYLRRASPLVSAGEKVTVMGRLDIGSWTDPETGFVSQIRIMDASFHSP
jgi:hypothetical protein